MKTLTGKRLISTMRIMGVIIMKIYSEELKKPDFDNIPMKELRDMVGWVEPLGDGTWAVKTSDDGGFICSNQETEHIMASVEEIKAMVQKLLRKIELSKENLNHGGKSNG